MEFFFNRILQGSFHLFEYKLSDFLSLLALIHMLPMEKRPISSNTNTIAHSTQVEIDQLHHVVNHTEHGLQTAMNSNVERQEQLNSLLDRSHHLLNKNQAFGAGIMDYRKDIEQKQAINRLKYIAIGILLLVITVLVIILNIVLDHRNNLVNRSTNIILE
jgi:small-conductance mechanosensitive channel